jgi:hypothetical protein
VKSILGQDHYSLLEVHRFAPKSEVVKAYHRMKAAFDPDSVATYSLFSPDEARAIAARIDEAFRVLIDERKKEIYDKWLQARERGEESGEPVFTRDAANDVAVATAVATSGTTEMKPFVPRRAPTLRPVPPGGFPAEARTAASAAAGSPAPAELSPSPAAAVAVSVAAPARPPISQSQLPMAIPVMITSPMAVTPRPPVSAPRAPLPPVDEEALRNILSTAGERDGSFFKAVREARGLELAQVADTTKISQMYLRFIEENNYRDMPAAVYLRGFLVQVGRFYKLEGPDQIADAYMALAEKRKKESS